MFLLVWKKRQVIHAAEIRAVAQSALGGTEAEQAYKDFIGELTQDTEDKKRIDLQEKLEAMKNITAIRVTPLDTTPARKLRTVEKP